MFRVVTDPEFPVLWIVVYDDPERGPIRVSGGTSDVFEAIHVCLPAAQARMAEMLEV